MSEISDMSWCKDIHVTDPQADLVFFNLTDSSPRVFHPSAPKQKLKLD